MVLQFITDKLSLISFESDRFVLVAVNSTYVYLSQSSTTTVTDCTVFCVIYVCDS